MTHSKPFSSSRDVSVSGREAQEGNDSVHSVHVLEKVVLLPNAALNYFQPVYMAIGLSFGLNLIHSGWRAHQSHNGVSLGQGLADEGMAGAPGGAQDEQFHLDDDAFEKEDSLDVCAQMVSLSTYPAWKGKAKQVAVERVSGAMNNRDVSDEL